jgi:hypothetical protein
MTPPLYHDRSRDGVGPWDEADLLAFLNLL